MLKITSKIPDRFLSHWRLASVWRGSRKSCEDSSRVFVLEALFKTGRGHPRSHYRDSGILSLLAEFRRLLRIVAGILLTQPELPDHTRAIPLFGGCTGSWLCWDYDSNGRCSRLWWCHAYRKPPLIPYSLKTLRSCRAVISIFLSGNWIEERTIDEAAALI